MALEPQNDNERLLSLVEGLKKCASDRERIERLDQDPHVKKWLHIHRGIQNLANGNVGASDLQQAQPVGLRTLAKERGFALLQEEQGKCKHILDAASCKDEDADEASGQILNHDVYNPSYLSQEYELVIKSLVAIGQEDHLLKSEAGSEKFKLLLEQLFPIEAFYKEIGGIVGYHWMLFSFLSQSSPLNEANKYYHRPPGIDISSENAMTRMSVREGIASLAFLAEIYPVGGAADRLKLMETESGRPLPAAKLLFCEHTLLEGLVRDVQAREYLYFKLFGEQITTPIAMMTSSEKNNHRHIVSLCEEKGWFGRPKDSFRLFCQPVVPTMDKQGKWCLRGPMNLLMKPGGHGVIWKVAEQEGIFDWLENLGRKKILIRQINNPIAGTDYGLLAFCGIGFREDKNFGFASCLRQVQSAEGVNILIERKFEGHSTYCLTNIEYCDFPKFSIEDVPIEPGSIYSQFPSNTNILFADIASVKKAIKGCPIPGMLVNLKLLSYTDEEGHVQSREVARLESTMQNIADCFVESVPSGKDLFLGTFLTYNLRRKTISTTKKLYQNDDALLETPEGCFYDLLQNAYDLLTQHCAFSLPRFSDPESYLKHGPSFLFSFHPALGPLYSVIGQKIRGGELGLRSELKLEIAEAEIQDLKLFGSLHVIAERIIGHPDPDGVILYSERVGRCRMHRVTIENRGIDLTAQNIYWKGEIERCELCEIIIHGEAEFVAEDVVLRGPLKIEVEEGTRLIAYEENGELKFRREPLRSGEGVWTYQFGEDNSIKLTQN